MNGVAGRPTVAARVRGAWDGDVAWSFRHSPVAVVSAIVLAVCVDLRGHIVAFGQSVQKSSCHRAADA